MDGLPLELIDGDSNMVNMDWIQATLRTLEEKLPTTGERKSKRFFVLSVMGVQSSGKSTLLNIMFGIQMRTSVGQCTRGINMQLIPVQGRAEYDYILLLDTEGTRSPEFKDLPGSEKRDNQMATLSILLADATIIVNPGENDAAIKEILPIVLLAYKGSKIAEEKGGRLSSMMFFVYNRIDTQQKEKLGSILQILGTSLHEAFYKVSQLSVLSTDDSSNYSSSECISNSTEKNLFRRFKLDASNSSESDVRIMGNIKKNFSPPDDVPDPAYGEALCAFREHIHSRVVGLDPGSLKQWTSRSLIEILDYLTLVWICIQSADFTLNFKTVLDRVAFEQLSREYKECEKKLTYLYLDSNAEIEKKILEMKQKPEGIRELSFEELDGELENSIRCKRTVVDNEIKAALVQSGRSKWKNDFETQWEMFKSVEKKRWAERLWISFQRQLRYDLHVDKGKKEMRLSVRKLFANENAKQWSADRKEKEFSDLYWAFIYKAQEN